MTTSKNEIMVPINIWQHIFESKKKKKAMTKPTGAFSLF